MGIPTAYIATWTTLLTFALIASLARPVAGALFSRAYLRFLAAPWRLVTAALGILVIAVAAPWSGDPTWDTADSVAIGLLTFAIAPWSVATMYRELRARRLSLDLVIAAILFWVPCWAYDAYVLWRDGHYPASWAPNLVLSGMLAACGGLFWNLGGSPTERSPFTFRWAVWPPRAHALPWRKVAAPMLAVALPVLVMVAAFIYDGLVGFAYRG